MAALASPLDWPVVVASQSTASAKPRWRWAPQSAARAAARARAAPHAFSVAANSSTTNAHSPPGNTAGSKQASASRNTRAASRTESDISLLRDTPINWRRAVTPSPRDGTATLPEHMFVVKRNPRRGLGLGCRDVQPRSVPESTSESQWRSPGPAHEQVAGNLRRAILAGELRPGERLPNEAELAASFNVSRTTIREALGTLVGERLIEKTRGLAGGSYVTEPSLDQLAETLQIGVQLLGRSEGFSVEEFIEIRTMLEVPAARLAAERRTDEDIAHLETTIPPLSRAHPDSRGGRTGEVRRHRTENWFHAAVVDTCRNRLLTLAIEPIFLVLQQQMNARSYGPAYHREIVKQHREIVDVIAAGDPDRSGDLMRQHLDWLRPSYAKVWKAPFA
jgi:DNA-binding FadR family transcriptional regulator